MFSVCKPNYIASDGIVCHFSGLNPEWVKEEELKRVGEVLEGCEDLAETLLAGEAVAIILPFGGQFVLEGRRCPAG